MPTFFPTPHDFRKWLDANHDKVDELWVGYYKKATKLPSMTWPESVDEALCYGWIDGIRKSVDEKSYKIRFTPRRPKSIWSAVNIDKVNKLLSEGRMQPAGMEVWNKRSDKRSKLYSFEQKNVKLDKAYEEKIKANKAAWTFWESLAPGYKKQTTWWVMSAKKEETRLRRLGIVIASSAEGKKIPHLRTKKDK